MKNLIILIGLSLLSLNLLQVTAQNESDSIKVKEVYPEFPGGQEEMYRYLSNNLIYPEIAIEKRLEGKVYIKFIVTRDGSIDNVEVLKSDNELLNEEALRLVKEMPKWSPGSTNGEKVDVVYTLPINFRLNKEIIKAHNNKKNGKR